MLDIKRQFITDSEGKPVAVILPIQEFALIEDVLDKQIKNRTEDESIALMREAIHDPLFLADLNETMSAFQAADIEDWEPKQ